ncbi:MAG: trypsin-like peptidase domain-containing protein [Alphaproteobacteria bacterium]|nr:trypsin-like peptidase domain-containing protein [Alphaproteobacteria bacterium]
MTLFRALLRVARALATTALGWVALVLIIGQILAVFEEPGAKRRPRAPETAAEVRRPPVPAPTPSPEPGSAPAQEQRTLAEPPGGPPYGGETAPGLPVAAVTWERKSQSAVGTAFRLDRDVWVTARHVTDSCQELLMLDGGKARDRAALLREHATADLALVAAGATPARLQISAIGPRDGRTAYAYGWPEDRPGGVRLSLLGSVRMRGTRSFPIDAVANAWAIVAVDPGDLTGYGGISGGPVLDAAGTVVGVAIGSNARRGTLSSAAWSDLNRLAAAGRPGALAWQGTPVPAEAWAAHGETLRRSGAIRQIYCRFKQG